MAKRTDRSSKDGPSGAGGRVAGKGNVTALVEAALLPGEELIATARVNYNGTIPANQFGVTTRMMVVDDAPVVGVDPDSTAFFPTASQMVLAMTGGRLFVWSLGISGKPKHFLGLVPMNSIAEASGADIGGGRHSLRVVMRSGAMVDLEFMRGEAGAEFLDQLRSLTGSPDATRQTAAIVAGEDGAVVAGTDALVDLDGAAEDPDGPDPAGSELEAASPDERRPEQL